WLQVPQERAVQASAAFRVMVEGSPRSMHTAARHEMYCMVREAVTNAFRHSRATRSEVELEFGFRELRVLVRDNGCGIDSQALDFGREGQWGLSGMRERAERIGAKLRVSSSGTGGTEVDLRVPGRMAVESH